MTTNAMYQDLEREFAAAFGEVKFIEYAGTARLGKGGDSDPVPVLAAERQYPTFPLFWCYRDGNTTNEPFQAVPWYPGLTYDNSQRHMEVFLVRFPQLDPKLRWIWGFTEIGLSAWNGVTPLQAGLANAAAVTTDKIMINSIYFSSGVTLGFRGGTMRYGDYWYELPPVTSFKDLTAYIPGTANQECWVNVSINTSSAVGIIQGSTFPDSETNKKNYCPNTVPSGGSIHLGSVLLANGLVTGTDDLITPFKDMFLAPFSSEESAMELSNLTDVASATQTANFVIAAGDGATGGEYRGRLLVSADIPATLTSKTLTSPTVNGVTNGTGLAAGTYTPTLTNVTNLDASTAYECQYLRVGNTVTVSGKVEVDPTAAGSTQLGISLPIASNLGAAEDCAGCAFASGVAGLGAAILGDAMNNRAQMQWIAVDVTNQPFYFTFTYQVI